MDYKKHALENLSNWLCDCLSCEEITSQDILNTFKEVVKENYNIYNNIATKSKELLDKLDEKPNFFKYEFSADDDLITTITKTPATYDEMISTGYEMTADGFWTPKEKWTLNVEEDPSSGEMFFTLPEDLVSKLSWKEGDEVEYIDKGDGTFLIRSVDKPSI